MEVRDLTARFAAFAARAPTGDADALDAAWEREVAAAHADVYGLYFTGPGDRKRWRLALPARVAAAEALAEAAERAVGALSRAHDAVAEWLGLGAPPRIFCTVLVGDGRTPAWAAELRGRLTLFLDAAALPADRTLLRGLAVYELTRLFHTLGSLAADNRTRLPAGALDTLPLGSLAVGHGLGGLAAVALVVGLDALAALTHGCLPEPRAWWDACTRGERALAGALAAICDGPGGGQERAWFGLAEAVPDRPRAAGRYLAWRAVERADAEPAAAPGDARTAALAGLPPRDAAAWLRGRLEVIAAAPRVEADH